MCCRCSAGTPAGQAARAGRARNGRSGAARCSGAGRQRRSAIACRWARCPMCRRRTIPTSIRATPPSRAQPLADCRAQVTEPATTAREPPRQRAPTSAQRRAGADRQRAGARRAGASSRARCAPRCTVEPRDGYLSVFMPPVEALEDYLELVAAVEAAAAGQGVPVRIEGYPPPPDPRLSVIKVTPDPGRHRGQHPAGRRAGARLVDDHRRRLRRGARQSRLGADKFMIDGRHTGTGGGNHVVLGGRDAARLALPAPARPAEEPGASTGSGIPSLSLSVLRPVHRPHQPGAAHRRGAPRRLYELEIALAQVPAPAGRAARRPGWSTGCSATCWSTSPATPTAPRSASTSCSRPTARPAGSAWSSSAASRCRRTRG